MGLSFGEPTWAALLLGAWLPAEAALPSIPRAGLGSGKHLFVMQDLKVIESTWHLERIRPVGPWQHSGKEMVFSTRFCSALPLYTTFTPETPLSSLE